MDDLVSHVVQHLRGEREALRAWLHAAFVRCHTRRTVAVVLAFVACADSRCDAVLRELEWMAETQPHEQLLTEAEVQSAAADMRTLVEVAREMLRL